MGSAGCWGLLEPSLEAQQSQKQNSLLLQCLSTTPYLQSSWASWQREIGKGTEGTRIISQSR